MNPLTANSSIMHRRLVCQHQILCLGEPAYLPPKKSKPTKLAKPSHKRVSQFCNFSDMLFDQRRVAENRLNWPTGQLSENYSGYQKRQDMNLSKCSPWQPSCKTFGVLPITEKMGQNIYFHTGASPHEKSEEKVNIKK